MWYNGNNSRNYIWIAILMAVAFGLLIWAVSDIAYTKGYSKGRAVGYQQGQEALYKGIERRLNDGTYDEIIERAISGGNTNGNDNKLPWD